MPGSFFCCIKNGLPIVWPTEYSILIAKNYSFLEFVLTPLENPLKRIILRLDINIFHSIII